MFVKNLKEEKMKPNQIKKTTNPFTFYRVEWLGRWDRPKQEVFITKEEANFFATHLKHVKHIDFVHTYEVTEKLFPYEPRIA